MPNRPLDLPAHFAEAWNRHDGEAIGALFVEDARFVNVVGMFWRDRAEITHAHVLAHRTMFANSRLEMLEVEEYPVPGGGTVAVHAHWRLTGQRGPDGAVDGPREGILLLIATQAADEAWRIAVAHNTDIVEGALTMPGAAVAR